MRRDVLQVAAVLPERSDDFWLVEGDRTEALHQAADLVYSKETPNTISDLETLYQSNIA